MVVADPGLRDEVELIDEEDAGGELLREVEDPVDVLGGLAQVLRGNHRKTDLEHRHVERTGHRERERRLPGPGRADEEEPAELVDAVLL
ncbi:hypothetical protein DSECCO2_534870 [anaerobic digester metagenome]